MTGADRADCLAVDIGGTKIAVARVDATGAVHDRRTAPTPHTGGADVLAVAGDLCAGLRALGPVRAIGVGAPGTVDAVTGVVVASTNVLPGWTNTPVRACLSARTGLPVHVVNDVHALAIAEARTGAGSGHQHVLHVAVGTGVGGALTSGGDLVTRSHGTTGEIAHLLVSTRGDLGCGCGRRDHLESVVAGPAIAASYAIRSGYGRGPITLRDVAARSDAGDSLAARVIDAAGILLGRALAGLVTALDVDAVVIGGGVAELGPRFLDPVRRGFAADVLPPLRDVPLLAARHGVDAPLLGAALLASAGKAADPVVAR